MGGYFKWFLSVSDADLGQLIPLALSTQDGSAASPVSVACGPWLSHGIPNLSASIQPLPLPLSSDPLCQWEQD